MTYDAIVIGAGSAGLTVAVGLARMGRRCLLVERRWVGGDCTNLGCIPSKSLLHLAAHPAGRDPAGVLARVRQRRDELRHHEELTFGALDGLDLRIGHVRVLGPHEVEVTDAAGVGERHRGRRLVIATGSRPRQLSVPGLDPSLVLTNETFFEQERLPEHLLVVGGGPVGVEMAQAAVGLGARVTLVEVAPRLLPQFLVRAGELVAERLEGIELRLGVGPERVEGRRWYLDDGSTIEQVDRALVALGRIPNREVDGLDELGVATDASGRIIIDEAARTSVEGVWAVGDVTDRGGSTHAAGMWGRRLVRSILFPRAPLGRVPPVPSVVWGDPEVATIGAQPEQPPAGVRRVVIEAGDLDRAYTDEIEQLMVSVDVRRLTGRIEGATIVGPRAGELISTVSLTMASRIGVNRWFSTVWPYPSHSEALGAVADRHLAALAGAVPAEVGSWVSGRLAGLIGFGRR